MEGIAEMEGKAEMEGVAEEGVDEIEGEVER